MSIRRVIIVPAILALGAAGSVWASSAMSPGAAHVPSLHAQASAAPDNPNLFYHT